LSSAIWPSTRTVDAGMLATLKRRCISTREKRQYQPRSGPWMSAMRILLTVAVLLLLAGCTVREVRRRQRPTVHMEESRFHVHALVAQHGNLGSTLLTGSPDTNGGWAVASGLGPCPSDVAELMTVIERDDFKFFDSDTVVPRADFLALVLHCGG